MNLSYSYIKLSIVICILLGYVTTNAQLQASFSATPLSGCSPHLVQFTNTSTGNPTSYLWNLGNGTQSSLPNPSVTYFTPGTYTVSLTVTNATGQTNTDTKTQYITVNAKPTVTFNASDTAGCFPLTVDFTQNSVPNSGIITSWQWDFGDGSGSNLPNPSHTYAQGNYSVVLQVTNSFGCVQTLVKPNYIKAQQGVVAAFNFPSPNTCNTPVTINLNNTSTGSGTLNYTWTFGDGNSSTQANPTHTYTTNGSYNITLTTSNNQGCTNTYIMPNAVSIGSNIAAFTAPDTVCTASTFTLNNNSTPLPSSNTWYLGNGNTNTATSPSVSYPTAGNYSIKLVANFGACKDSISKPIVVLPLPNVSFTTPDTANCIAPYTVLFTNNSASATSYSWNFGDGAISTATSPTHTYTSTGSYTVSLTATNAFGCSNTITKIAYIVIQEPAVSLTNMPDSGCAPLSIQPNILINAVDGVASYSWNFGDGFTTTASNPTHTYNTAGVYNLTLTITTNGGCTKTVTSIVKVGNKPNVLFSAIPTTNCAFYPISFSNQATGNPLTYYYWQFGDGGISTLPNPIYQYQDTGYFNVTLIVGSNGCYDTLRKQNFIYIKPPIARFTPLGNCATPYTYNFTDASIGATTYNYTFGDGSNSTLPSPSHTYTAPGVYTVTLTVTNDTCMHTISKIVRVIDEYPTFSAAVTTICRNNAVNFVSANYIRSNINAMQWNFGDGTIIAGDSLVSHIYTAAGIYTVQLITTDLNGCKDTATNLQYITVYGATAGFSSSPTGSCLNSPITFTSTSTTDGTHPITNYTFAYGDGVIQAYTAPPFVHQYSGTGTYTVSLLIVDAYGCRDSITKVNEVAITKPTANFNTPDTLYCPNTLLSFVNTSIGSNPIYLWKFGDGAISTQISPQHAYATDGAYTVTLIVTDANGCIDSLVKPQYILINSPQASFSVNDSFSTCPPLFVQFTNTSNNYLTSTWHFGDGSSSTIASPSHAYTTAGTFVATLTVNTFGGCVHTFTKNIIVKGPSGIISYTPLSGCKPHTVTFTANAINTTGYIWDFNNGQTITTNNNSVTYTYTQIGKYLPRIILKDNLGCSVPVLGLDSIKVIGVQNIVTANKTILCDSGSVQFNASATSNDIITNYRWLFGDGATSAAQNPNHSYNTTGNYTVQCITTTQVGCKDTTNLPLQVSVVRSPDITITGPTGACIPATAQFSPQIVYADTAAMQWQWNFGNGQTFAQQNPNAIAYPAAGTYLITATVLNSLGCRDAATTTFTAYSLPTVNAGADVLLCKTPTQLQATGATTYAWLPATNLSCTTCANPQANPDSTKVYSVTGTDINGCNNTDTVLVKVTHPFNMLQSPGTGICIGKSVNLLANGAITYQWTPSTGLNNTNTNTVVAKPTVTTQYRVIGTDSFNCYTDTGFITIIVHPLPTVNAGNDVTIVGGNNTQLNTITTGGVTTYNWTNSNTLTCANCPNPTAKPTKTTTYRVNVTNVGGCAAADEVTVFVVCDKGNLFLPNTFSPNKDGMNDVFYPRGNGIYSVKSFKIFDRWGELVFEKNNFAANDASSGWNGIYKGKLANTDVYVYMIEVFCEAGNTLGFKGNVTLLQ